MTDEPTPFADLNALLGELVAGARRALGPDFVGAYVQGSFALGDADVHSDCDFLIAVARPIAPAQEAALPAMHDELPTRPGRWTTDLEGSYAPVDDLRSLAALGRPWLYVDRGHRSMEGSLHCNTEVVRWILREHGIVLAGPPPDALVEPVPPDVLRARMREEAARSMPTLRSLDVVGARVDAALRRRDALPHPLQVRRGARRIEGPVDAHAEGTPTSVPSGPRSPRRKRSSPSCRNASGPQAPIKRTAPRRASAQRDPQDKRSPRIRP